MNVLITRPLFQAHASACQLEKFGFHPHNVPLVEIVPLEFIVPNKNFDALLATSANAFRRGENGLAHLCRLPLFCVGEHTRIAAQKAGFSNIAAVVETAAQLVSLFKDCSSCHFLYLAGRVRRPILEQKLAVLGHKIIAVETYHSHPLCPNDSELTKLPQRFDAALFYSALAACQAGCLATFFDEQTQLLCLSVRIADSLPVSLQPRARLAAHPNEASLFELLRAHAKMYALPLRENSL